MNEQQIKTQPTPGPWGTIRETAGYITVTGPSGFGIAEVDIDDTFDQQEPGEADANARLIAAAPDLYEALEQARRGKVVNNWLTGGAFVCLICGELPETRAHDDDCWVPKADAAIAKAVGS